MAKRSGDKNSSKNIVLKKACDNKESLAAEFNESNNPGMLDWKNYEHMPHKCTLIKSESTPILRDLQSNNDDIENSDEKICIGPKKMTKGMNDKEDIRSCTTLRLSHIVIVDSVLKENNINPHMDALLPLSLNNIYQKFINSKKYVENLHTKDEFYRGVGLLGVGIEERIYNKRKMLEESIKRRCRLRPNPKPRRQFDGTIINRPLKNRSKTNMSKESGAKESKDAVERVKCNIFTIGDDLSKRGRKALKKKSVTRRAAAHKLEQAKKALSEAYRSSDDEPVDNQTRSIAQSRAKRQPKVPQLDFKYCYNDDFGMRARKCVTQDKEEQYMEIVDSDSSSVIEVFPTPDRDNSDSDHRRSSVQERTAKYVGHSRRVWYNKDNRALNLLDKLRLGLQCTVLQTEHDIIIQNLTVDDLATLRSRLQGLATFKNIEAEYDKNGQETARATIDRRMLNLPFKSTEMQLETQSVNGKKHEESLKRKLGGGHTEKPKPLNAVKEGGRGVSAKIDDYCSNWVRPKGRSVKKIRKLYTQSTNMPNILARSQGSSRPDDLSRSTHRLLASKSSTSSTEMPNNTQHSSVVPVSFYPQITSVSVSSITEPVDCKTIKLEPFISTMCTTASSTSSSSDTSATPVSTFVRNVAFISSQSTTDSSQRATTSATITSSSSVSGTPATAMSASQLLMLRKGACQSSSDIASPSTPTVSMSRNDQLFANQILKPFKKILPASSPSKLEIDDEEADFELTPSIIAHAKKIDVSVSSTCSLVSVPNKSSFVSKPLIQPIDVVASNRRTIHLASSSTFQTHNSFSGAAPLSSSRLVACTMPPDRESCALVTASFVPLSAALSVPAPVLCSAATIPVPTHVQGPSLKIKHNFLSSSKINFREVLCAPSLTKRTPIPILPAPPPPPPTRPLLPAKGSSVVLKSLLVGSNAPHDLCLVNRSATWASKYLATNSGGQDSKIKWQLGGSVVPSQPVFVAAVSKENKSLELVNSADVL